METEHRRRTDVLNRRSARHTRIGFAASVILHIVLFLAFRTDRLPPTPFAAAGPAAGDAAAAAGGGMQSLALRSPVVPAEVPRPPEPVATPEVEVEPVETDEPELEPVEIGALAGAPPGSGADDDAGDAGREDGDGSGAGGDAESGRSLVSQPRPRGLTLPPGDRPDDVRGREIEVWVFVDAEGRVVADSTRLNPPTGNRGFDQRLRERAAEWVFEPAMRGGRAVAEWYPVVFGL